jgi:hypothetical protein
MKLLQTISIIASLTLAPVVSSAQGFTGLISINRELGGPAIKLPTDPVSHTFVAFVGNGVVFATATWGDNSMLLGAWGRNTLTDTMSAYAHSSTTIAQSAFDQGLYNVIYTGGTIDHFLSTYADAITGFAHPNLGFVFNCKWAAWVFGNNFYYAATGTPAPTVYDVPDPAYTNTELWVDAHLHPAYWMALQRSATDPMALVNYNNAITLQAQLKDKLM